MSTEYEGRLFIDGEFTEAASGRRFDVTNPADESVIGTAADAGAEDVARAVAAARRAADETDWADNREFRRHCLTQLQEGLRKQREAASDLQTAEAGIAAFGMATHVDQPIADMWYFNELISKFSWECDYGPHKALGMVSERRVRYEPYGVVGAITPWNVPFMSAVWKVHHALATGNTIVLKTSPDTPFSGALIARVSRESTDIPPGVLNVIGSADKAAAGEALTGHPDVDMFHFTGSHSVGERIAQRAAVGFRKVCLELGGKSANIIFPDADLDRTIRHSVMNCMANSGQGCALATRMVVHSDIYDDVVGRLEKIISELPWGDPRDASNVVGPIIRLEQLERVEGLVNRARDAGARVPVGGCRGDIAGKGFWYPPTLVVDVDENAEIAQTEVFGPVLTVVKYRGGEDEAIRVANNSPYGLSAYIQTGDRERAWRVANRLQAGTVNVGRSFFLSPDTPFGGYGFSGVGREHGEDGFREYLQAKTIATPAPR